MGCRSRSFQPGYALRCRLEAHNPPSPNLTPSARGRQIVPPPLRRQRLLRVQTALAWPDLREAAHPRDRRRLDGINQRWPKVVGGSADKSVRAPGQPRCRPRRSAGAHAGGS